MQIDSLKIPEIKLFTNKVFPDSRGFFTERLRLDVIKELGVKNDFVQENFSRSAHNVLRGVHFQYNLPQAKLVTCSAGKIYDIAVDVRRGSPTFGQYVGVELDGDKPQWLWIPAGFAHGFCVLSKQGADVFYKIDAHYNPKGEEGINWNDPDLKIDWPITKPVVSDKDNQLLSFVQYKKNPRF